MERNYFCCQLDVIVVETGMMSWLSPSTCAGYYAATCALMQSMYELAMLVEFTVSLK
jgi:hypothetical protein